MERNTHKLKSLAQNQKWMSMRFAYFRKYLSVFRELLPFNNPASANEIFANSELLRKTYHQKLTAEAKAMRKKEKEFSVEVFMLPSSPSHEFEEFRTWRDEALRLVDNENLSVDSFKEKAQEDQIGEQRMTLMQVLDSWEAFVDHVIKIDTLVDNTNTYFDSIKSISLDDFLAKFPPKDRIDDPERSNFANQLVA